MINNAWKVIVSPSPGLAIWEKWTTCKMPRRWKGMFCHHLLSLVLFKTHKTLTNPETQCCVYNYLLTKCSDKKNWFLIAKYLWNISIVNVLNYISGYSAGQLCELKWNWLHMSTKKASWLKEIAKMFQKVKLVLRKDILFTEAKDHFPGPPFAIQSWPPSNTTNYNPCSTISKSSKRQIMSKEECNKHSCSQLFH